MSSNLSQSFQGPRPSTSSKSNHELVSDPKSSPKSNRKKVQTANFGKGNIFEKAAQNRRTSINPALERDQDSDLSDGEDTNLSHSLPSSSIFDFPREDTSPPQSPPMMKKSSELRVEKMRGKEVDLPFYDSSPDLVSSSTSHFRGNYSDPKLVHRSASDSEAQPRAPFTSHPPRNNASWKPEESPGKKFNIDLDFYRHWTPKSWKKDKEKDPEKEHKEKEKEQREKEKEQRKREKEAKKEGLFNFGRRRRKWEEEPEGEIINEKMFRILVSSVPKRKVALNGPEELVGQFEGPNSSNESEINTVASAISLSTYPSAEDGSKFGDPVCDRYALKIFKKFSILTLADGCGWGPRAKEAAVRATTMMNSFLEKNCKKIKSTKDATDLLLQGIEKSHASIFEGKAPEDTPGTTTIIAGLLLLLEEPEYVNGVSHSSIFICVNVGDCKALHWNVREQSLEDITVGNRQNLFSATDPGGRLGPNPEGEPIPDLRNLQTYYSFCSEGDVIALVSDGVHDNFDPQMVGIPPSSLDLKAETWDALKSEDVAQVGKAKSKKWKELFETNVIAGVLKEKELDPSKLTHAVIDYCVNITQKSRDWMQSHRGQLPSDYHLFPGKLDHTTMLSTKVRWSSS